MARNIYRILFISGIFVTLFFFSVPFHRYILRKSQDIAQVFHTEKVPSVPIVQKSKLAFLDIEEKEVAPWKNRSWAFSFSPKELLPSPPPPPPENERNPYLPIPQRITASHTEGENLQNFFASNYTSLDILLGGTYVPGKFLPMLNFQGDRFDDITYAASAGIVTRIIPSLSSNFRQILGFNVFYDYRQGNIGYYNQLALGLEILGKRWDFRSNIYFPFGAKRRVDPCKGAGHSHSYMENENLLESLSYSFNAEVGWLAINSKYLLLYFAGGPYYISEKHQSGKTRGGEFRIQPQYKDFIALNLSVSHDPVFNTIYQAEAIVHLPLYLFAKKIPKKQTCGITPRQIYQPVERFQVMPLGRASCWSGRF